MALGTVKWFSMSKGYGFIEPAAGGKDVFVHITAVKAAGLGELTEGMNLSYELETRPDGRMVAGRLEMAS